MSTNKESPENRESAKLNKAPSWVFILGIATITIPLLPLLWRESYMVPYCAVWVMVFGTCCLVFIYLRALGFLSPQKKDTMNETLKDLDKDQVEKLKEMPERAYQILTREIQSNRDLSLLNMRILGVAGLAVVFFVWLAGAVCLLKSFIQELATAKVDASLITTGVIVLGFIVLAPIIGVGFAYHAHQSEI